MSTVYIYDTLTTVILKKTHRPNFPCFRRRKYFLEDENDIFYRGYLPGYNDIVIDHSTEPRYFAELTFIEFILADSNSVDLAEKNKGSLDMVPDKFGDRNVVTFLALLGKCKKYFLKNMVNISIKRLEIGY